MACSYLSIKIASCLVFLSSCCCCVVIVVVIIYSHLLFLAPSLSHFLFLCFQIRRFKSDY